MLIYRLRNTQNNKVYIGQHRFNSLKTRWNKSLSNVRKTSHLALAIRKWGATAFRREVICHASCQREADLLEQFWIAHYRSADRRFGYNNELGGLRGALRHSEATKRRISESVKRFWANMPPDQRAQVREKRKEVWRSRTAAERAEILLPVLLANFGKTSPFKGKKRKRGGCRYACAI